jgi:hypothetical protein
VADNIELDAGSGGAVIAADDITSVWYQINKLAFGALNTATLVSTSNGLPVDIRASNANVTVVGTGTLAVQVDGNALTALQLIDDVVAVLGTATYTETSTKGNVIGVVRNDALAALAGTDNEIAPLQVNASGALYVQEGAALDVSGATVTVDLAGNNDVTIDASSIVLAEDAAHSTGDAGVQMLAVRKATPADLSGTDGDYEPLQLDNGRLWASSLITGDALTALQLIDDPVVVLGTATYTETTTSGNVIGVVRNDALAALAGTDNEIAPLQVNASGALYAVLSAGAAVVGEVTIGAATGAAGDLAKIEDAQHASGDVGVMSLAVRNDALAALGGTDGDYVPFQADAAGALYTRPHSSSTGGCKMFTSVDLDESEEDPASSALTIYGIYAWNATAAPLWLQLFNTNTVTVGTTAPTNNFMIPANADSDGAGVVIPIPVCGLAYSTALTVAITTGSGTDNGAPGAGDAGIVILYQD